MKKISLGGVVPRYVVSVMLRYVGYIGVTGWYLDFRKQLDRFLETLQILTCCQFGEVTFEGVIKMKTVLGFGLLKILFFL